MTNTPPPAMTYLADYRPPSFLISTVALEFDLQTTHTAVRARIAFNRNPQAADPAAPLELAGEALELIHIALNDVPLGPERYTLDSAQLSIAGVPEHFTLTTTVHIYPERNTQLMGLFASRNGYFTQCEAEGFRRLTFYLDRPDVMACFTTTIHADRTRFPVLLSNGNPVAQGQSADARHWVRWADPHPKPAYLFALVAAQLDLLEDHYLTASGRPVTLNIYVEPGRLDQCGYAMAALKSSMQWDEEVFGLEIDLDQYTIVAVSDFNMGAMENKGLNIFNTKFVLARGDLATDHDFMMLDRVIAHEYFHNWTGNRVTCRDWFQLSLKEGLTVFRDQQYGGDRYSHAVQRIGEVRGLRNSQFPEDAGPMAHPVRPSAYLEINNFYTATIYEKGAEVVRLIHTLLGAPNFRRGMDLYFARHDGQAVCTEDFVRAMQDASGVDLSLLQRWYDQVGTPQVRVTAHYAAERQEYTLNFEQSCPRPDNGAAQLPLPIPIKLGLLNRAGHAQPLVTHEPAPFTPESSVYLLTEAAQSVTFTGITSAPVPSLLRGFSAPVKLAFDYPAADLALLMAHDSDAFNRWEAGQKLAMQSLLGAMAAAREGREPDSPSDFIAACACVLSSAADDPAFAAEVLSLPTATFIAEQMAVVDPDAIAQARTTLRRAIALALRAPLLAGYHTFTVAGSYAPTPAAVGYRALRNVCLGYLMELGEPAIEALCHSQFQSADNMTDAMAALGALANSECPQRVLALAAFYAQWQKEPLVIDKWFSVQATSRLPDTLRQVEFLLSHPDFSLTNPNRVRSLIGAFCQSNQLGFHLADGSGYRFAARQICALDAINPQVAARLARAFDRWGKFDDARQHHARAALREILAQPGLSKDTTEIVTRTLG